MQGRVTVRNEELDDFVLLRSDGSPTYMLAVVVDDHDMGVTHVIRGDDHLNNAFRQLAIVRAMGWPEPVYAHVPLIHGADGAKLSKRHGALGVETYRDELGILPEALFNYLLRLGWGHGDDEIISRDEARALVRPAACRPLALALRHSRSSRISTAIICARPTRAGSPACRPRIEGALGRGLDADEIDLLAAGDARADAAREGPERAGGGRRLPVQAAAAGHGREGRGPARGRGAGPARPRPRRPCRRWTTGPPRRRSRRCGRLPRPKASSSARWRSRCARRSPGGRRRREFSTCWRCSGGRKASPASPTR